MRKIFGLSFVFVCLSGCDVKTRNIASIRHCPANAPLFTEELGTQLVNNWGTRLFAFSPKGSKGYTEEEVGAIYFTAANYLPNAVLLPTVSKQTRNSSQLIYNYFSTNFLGNCPIMTNNPPTAPDPQGPFLTLSGCGYGVISGFYDFTYKCIEDPDTTTRARYTFQFQYLDSPDTVTITPLNSTKPVTVVQPSGWYIMLQNSAALPKA